MECPFCNESIKDEAIACKSCSRDLRFVRPTLIEIQDLVGEIDDLTHRLDRAEVTLFRLEKPLRYFATHAAIYIVGATIPLVAAHAIVTIALNVSPLYLRIASMIIPLLFGLVSVPLNKLGILGSVVIGVPTACLSVWCMLIVTGLNDNVPIMPASFGEWREVAEYAASISLAFVSGNILGFVLFRVLPSTLGQGGKPNAMAFRLAKLLGEHVGHEQLRRRARLIQDLIQTLGPLAAAGAGAVGSIYTGLKGVIGSG